MIRSFALPALVLFVSTLACSSGSSRGQDAASSVPDAALVEDVPVSEDDGAGLGPDGPADARTDDGGEEAGPVDAGRRLGKFVGNITTRRQVRGDFAQYWDQITPENEGKWGSVERTQGTFNWTAMDAIYKFAQESHVVFKEHCFVWGSQQTGWANNENGREAVRNWIASFCQRYPETAIIDVVNEPPPHTVPAYMESIGGSGVTGWDWIVNAFTWAREACPKAILVLNDYDNAENADAAQHTIDIVNTVRKAGAPVDAIGCQAHGTYGQATASVKANIDRIATETGLPVYVTEYDIDIADDELQRSVMQEQLTMFWENPHIKGITLWGYVYGQTWLTNTGILRSDGSMRPAMSWLMNHLGR